MDGHPRIVPPPPNVVRALRRSRTRSQLLVALAHRRVAYVGVLAAACGIPHDRAAAALMGRLPGFRVDLSPRRLGLVRVADSPTGILVAITPAGDRAVAWLAAEGRVPRLEPSGAGDGSGAVARSAGDASREYPSSITWSVTCAPAPRAVPLPPTPTKGI